MLFTFSCHRPVQCFSLWWPSSSTSNSSWTPEKWPVRRKPRLCRNMVCVYECLRARVSGGVLDLVLFFPPVLLLSPFWLLPHVTTSNLPFFLLSSFSFTSSSFCCFSSLLYFLRLCLLLPLSLPDPPPAAHFNSHCQCTSFAFFSSTYAPPPPLLSLLFHLFHPTPSPLPPIHHFFLYLILIISSSGRGCRA